MCKFAEMGVTGKWYIDNGMYVLPLHKIIFSYSVVYGKRGYKEVVEKISEESMQSAVEEAKGQANYSTSGEVYHVHTCMYQCSVHYNIITLHHSG